MHTDAPTHSPTLTYKQAHNQKRADSYKPSDARIHTNTQAQTHRYTSTRKCTLTDTCSHTHKHTFTHIHTHTRIHSNRHWGWGWEYTDWTLCWRVIASPKKWCCGYDTKLYLIQFCRSGECVVPIIAITSTSTLKIICLEKCTWNHISVGKWFILRIVSWS